MVQAIHDMSDLLISDGREVPAPGQVLANQSVGVFVQSPLPGSIGPGEVELGLKRGGNRAMTGEFFAVVER